MNTTTDLPPLHTRDDALHALVRFLRDFEAFQEHVDIRRVGVAHSALRELTAGLFPALLAALDTRGAAPEHDADSALPTLRDAVADLEQGVSRILAGHGPGFAQAFVDSRQNSQRALSSLYGVRRAFPLLQPYFVTADALAEVDALDAPAQDCTVATGLITLPSNADHNAASLYVPESYTPSRQWPLIVCLHGGYGHGNEYLWTWLRLARSARALLLSPKSCGLTWSIVNPNLDINSIRAMLKEIAATWRVDVGRIFLSGLSDGGTFSYLLGLAGGSIFAGVAPVAGVLPELVDPLLRGKHGLETPLFIVHGAQDFIFDVRGVRSTSGLLEKLGYRVTFTELPEWGHAFPYAINETLVLPWFRSLGLDGDAPAR